MNYSLRTRGLRVRKFTQAEVDSLVEPDFAQDAAPQPATPHRPATAAATVDEERVELRLQKLG